MIGIHPVPMIPEIRAGDDIGALMAKAIQAFATESGDILVVTQKIISKSEARWVSLEAVHPGAEAREIAAAIGKDPRLVQLVLDESTDIIRAERGVLITRHRLGLVMANAGIDCSNIGPGTGERALLLPLDPDASAQAISHAIQSATGRTIGVLISDSFGRPWRHGVVNVAIGSFGIPALIDRRGATDRDGRALQATLIAAGDLLASAAGLAMGEAEEGIPAALIRGLVLPDRPVPASALVRPVTEDLFR